MFTGDPFDYTIDIPIYHMRRIRMGDPRSNVMTSPQTMFACSEVRRIA